MKRIAWNKGKTLDTKYPQLRDVAWLQEQLNRTSMQRLAKEIGCSYKRVYDAKIEMGIVPEMGSMRKTADPKHPEIIEKKDEIVASYLSGELTSRELAVKFGVPVESMAYYLNRKWKVGAPIKRKTTRPDGRVVTMEEIEVAYYPTGITAPKAAKSLGISLKAFKKFMTQYGIPKKIRETSHPLLRDVAWVENEYINKNRSMMDIAKSLGVSKGSVNGAIRHIDINIRKSHGTYFGENASNWKGGTKQMSSGYIYQYAVDHPNATQDGYVLRHRLVMEKHIGRYLTQEEIVHHKNGTKGDDRIENLELSSDRGAHTRDHFERSHVTEAAELEVARLKKLLSDNGIES